MPFPKKFAALILFLSAWTGGASASWDSFETYLTYYNERNPTPIKADQWYSITALIRGENDLVGLFRNAAIEGVNLVLEEESSEVGSRALGRYEVRRWLVESGLSHDNAYLQYELHCGLRGRSLHDYRVSLGGDWRRTPIVQSPRYGRDLMFYIPSRTDLQIDLKKHWSHDEKDRWRQCEDLMKVVSRISKAPW